MILFPDGIATRNARSMGGGAILHYLPQYSPDLNPIEMPFSSRRTYQIRQRKRGIVRSAALRRRAFSCTLTDREAGNYFRHAGYL